MKIFKLYFIFLLLFLAACVNEKPNRSTKLIKHTVFVLHDPVHNVFKDTSYLDILFMNYQLTDIQTLDSSIHVHLKYADTSNFLKRDFYDGLSKAYFPCEVAARICNAQYYLKQIDSTLTLLILDATRPLHVQQLMWDSLKMPPDKKFNYLSPPYILSLHNYGCAVDLTILDLSTGKALDMGSEFDHFGKLSEPVYEWQFLKTGELTKEAFENRKLLRKVMQAAKLNPITSEWWHFNFCSKEYASATFTLIK